MADLTREQLRTRLQNLGGLDLEDDEANDFLEEGHRELCTRSEWTRENVAIGSTALNTAAYAIPSDIFRILKLYVDGFPYRPTSEEEVQELVAEWLRLRVYGLFWHSFTSAGVEQVSIYPTPTTAGLAIVGTSIVYPAALDDDADTPAVPREFQPALIHYAAARALELVEDDPEMGQFHQERFEDYVARLRAHRLTRRGRGPVMMKIAGVHRV